MGHNGAQLQLALATTFGGGGTRQLVHGNEVSRACTTACPTQAGHVTQVPPLAGLPFAPVAHGCSKPTRASIVLVAPTPRVQQMALSLGPAAQVIDGSLWRCSCMQQQLHPATCAWG